MGENIFSPEEMEHFSILATEAHQIGVITRSEIEDLRVRQEQLSGYAYNVEEV